MKYSLIAITAAAALLSSCTVGPNYARPTVPVPNNFRAPEPLPAAASRISGGSQVVRDF